MKLLPGKPAVPTELLPGEIIGYDNMSQFTQHMRIACKRVDGDWPGKELAKIGPGVRNMVADALSRLFENGYLVDGFDKNGEVVFVTRLKSACDDLFDGPELARLQRLSLAELQKAGRSTYRQTVDSFSVNGASRDEMDFSRLNDVA
jgi:hypothetical protein